MRHTGTLTKLRMRLALRNRAFIFFSLIMPLAFLFLYSSVFGRGEPRLVAYMLPGVLALTVMGSFWGLSIQLVMFREQGILRRFRLTPAGPGAMLASSVVSNLLLTMPTIVLELLLVKWIYKVESLGNLWGLFLLAALGTMTFASLGLIVASVTNTMQETQVINNAIWFVFLFLSGATIPLPFLPLWLQQVSVFFPPTYLVTGLQQAVVAGVPVSLILPEIAALAVATVFSFLISLQLFRWEPEQKVTRQAKAWAAAAMLPFLLLGAYELTFGSRLDQAQELFRSVQRPPMPGEAPPSGAPAPR
jgi:ABC-2 type transport system permease protein